MNIQWQAIRWNSIKSSSFSAVSSYNEMPLESMPRALISLPRGFYGLSGHPFQIGSCESNATPQRQLYHFLDNCYPGTPNTTTMITNNPHQSFLKAYWTIIFRKDHAITPWYTTRTHKKLPIIIHKGPIKTTKGHFFAATPTASVAAATMNKSKKALIKMQFKYFPHLVFTPVCQYIHICQFQSWDLLSFCLWVIWESKGKV